MADVFGPHVILDLSGCPNHLLTDLEHVYKFVDELPNKIGMTKITQTHVFRYSGLIPEDHGITGGVVIAESHIQIHTFAGKGFAFIDVFSCKPFNTELVEEQARRFFQPGEVKAQLIQRGESFPR